MRKINSIPMLLFLFTAFTLWGQTELKIMTFNIHNSADATLEVLGAFIKEQAPDLVALQEVDYYTDRSQTSTLRPHNNNEDMLTSLAYYSGMQGIFFPAIDVHGGKYGNAILSRFGMTYTEIVPLPQADGTEGRVAGICRVRLPDETIVTCVSTHLDMASLENGLEQVKELNRLFASSDTPVILGGDLNRRIGTEHIDEFEKVWTLAVSNAYDHIGYLPADRWEVKEVRIYDDVDLSDHAPVMVTMILK